MVARRALMPCRTRMETQEVQEKRHKWVWRPEKIEYYETVRKSVPVTERREVPYTTYEPQSVDIEVEVPVETVRKEQGYRVDRVLKKKPLEVEQDIIYEMRPHRVGAGPLRYREPTDGRYMTLGELGRVAIGEEVFPGGYTRRPQTPSVAGSDFSARGSVRSARGSVRSARGSAMTTGYNGGGHDGATVPLWVCPHGIRGCAPESPCPRCEERAFAHYRVDDAALGPVYLPTGVDDHEGGASCNTSWRGDAAWRGEATEHTPPRPPSARPSSARSTAPRPATALRASARPPSAISGPRPVTPQEVISQLGAGSWGGRGPASRVHKPW